VDTFSLMIEEFGLAVVFTHGDLPFRTANHQYYFIGIMRASDAAPPWARAPLHSLS